MKYIHIYLLYSYYSYNGGIMKKGFTLAEVLITLGIIGVVAAMTIPGLITKWHKQATAAKVKKFYSSINQTIRLSSVENEEPESWTLPAKRNNYNENKLYYNTYFAPYMKTMAMKKVKVGSSDYTNSLAVALMDGGGLILNLEETTMKFWYITDYKELEKPDFHKKPRIFFEFQLGKRNSKAESSRTDKNFIVPFTFQWDGNYESLKTNPKYGCSRSATNRAAYCTKLLMINNWVITPDYQW